MARWHSFASNRREDRRDDSKSCHSTKSSEFSVEKSTGQVGSRSKDSAEGVTCSKADGQIGSLRCRVLSFGASQNKYRITFGTMRKELVVLQILAKIGTKRKSIEPNGSYCHTEQTDALGSSRLAV